MYTFCSTFHCSPEEYNNTSCEDVDVLLLIHKEVKELKHEDAERLRR